MFTEAVIIILYKEINHPSGRKWINWFSHSKEYYTAVTMNKVDLNIKRYMQSKRGDGKESLAMSLMLYVL